MKLDTKVQGVANCRTARAAESWPLTRHAHHIPANWSQAATARCSCHDFLDEAWCKHVAALGYELINRCHVNPFYPFELRAFDVVSMLPRKRVASGPAEVICIESDDDDGAVQAGEAREGGEAGSSRDNAVDLTSESQ